MRTNKVFCTTLSICACGLGLLLPPSPAAADLPLFYCEFDRGAGPNLGWCLSYENNFVSVSVANKAATTAVPYAPFKLELAYYPADGGPAQVPRRSGRRPAGRCCGKGQLWQYAPCGER